MADISRFLHDIEVAVYGEEVRGSIHDALAAMNVESSGALEAALISKDSAANSAAAALMSAGKALTSEENAKTSEENALASEQKAKESETAAATSEEHAKASETAAGISEANAQTSANASAASATASALSALNAATSETNARTSEGEAKVAQMAAEAAKGDAITARDDARAAKEDAQTALTSTETAKTAAQGFAAQAGDHAAAALNAKAAAEAAQTASEQAQEASETAQSIAESARDDAQGSASEAAASAEDAATSAQTAKDFSGKPPKPQDGTWWIWNPNTQQYEDSGIACDLVGPRGNGIEDIQLKEGTHLPGTTDVYEITTTDGDSYTFSVFNGHNGTGVGDVIGSQFELTLPMADWNNGEITVGDSRLVASRAFKYLVAAQASSEEEYVECRVKPRDVILNGFITFFSEYDPQHDLVVHVVRLELSA